MPVRLLHLVKTDANRINPKSKSANPKSSRSCRIIRGVGDLIFGQRVDRQTHRFELDAGDVLVEFFGQVDDRVGQRLAAFVGLHQVQVRHELVGEAHVHHFRRVAFGGSEVDQM